MFIRSISFIALTASLATSAAAEMAAEGDAIVVTGTLQPGTVRSATKTDTAVKDVPQSITVVSEAQIEEQAMLSIGDVLNYVAGATIGQGEGNRDQITLRGNVSTADFFVDGLRDDVQYYRDLYNADRVEILKGPNAMIFGRGGGGGVINRVTKRALDTRLGEFSLLGDQRGSVRLTGDINLPIGEGAGRLNAVYENSDSFRDSVDLERYGVNPTAGVTLGDTRIDLAYEYFHDRRTADRGIPSLDGRPIADHRRTFFGDPEDSFSRADVHLASFALEHRFNDSVSLRNRTQYADYDKFYQNIYPTSATSLAAYNNLTERENLITQTDLVWEADVLGVYQTILVGFELAKQETRNLRNTGFFQPADTSTFVISSDDPTVDVDVLFRLNGSDADNESRAKVAAFYVQDQLRISNVIEIVAGLRFDRFEVDLENFRNGQTLDQTDTLVSPRLGVVIKPLPTLSLYASYGRSYLPASGDQFSSLSASTVALKPERFDNYEIGAKWEVLPGMLATLALYQLDRTNTRANGPNNTIVLTGAQRSRGLEIDLAGAITPDWQVTAGYALQEAEITETTTSAPSGREVPLVPRHQFSVWSRYDVTDRLGVGLGIIAASKSYASISNAVTLPGYARVDAGLFYRVSDAVEAQINVENLFDEQYFPTAHNDNNIGPGAPTTVRGTLRFKL